MQDEKVIVVFLLILIMVPVFGQEKWTLGSCIRYAVENNLDIKQDRFNVEMAEQNYRQYESARTKLEQVKQELLYEK